MTIQEELEVELRKWVDKIKSKGITFEIVEFLIPAEVTLIDKDYSSDRCDAIAKLLGWRLEILYHVETKTQWCNLFSFDRSARQYYYCDTHQTEKLPAIQVALTTLLREENEKTEMSKLPD